MTRSEAAREAFALKIRSARLQKLARCNGEIMLKLFAEIDLKKIRQLEAVARCYFRSTVSMWGISVNVKAVSDGRGAWFLFKIRITVLKTPRYAGMCHSSAQQS